MEDIIIKFHEDFYDVIRLGIKTATSRVKPKNLERDDVFLIHFVNGEKDSEHEDLLGRITNVTLVQFQNLDYINARKEGYLHKSLLQHELLNFYPNLQLTDIIYIYEFEII